MEKWHVIKLVKVSISGRVQTVYLHASKAFSSVIKNYKVATQPETLQF